MHIQTPENTWISTSQNGKRTVSNETGQIIQTLPDLRVSTEFLPRNEKLTISREDYVNVVYTGIKQEGKEGSTSHVFDDEYYTCTSQFPDGTRVFSETFVGRRNNSMRHPYYEDVSFSNGNISKVDFGNGVVIEKIVETLVKINIKTVKNNHT